MTGTGRFIPNHGDPRHTDTRAFGRELAPLQALGVGESNIDVADGKAAERLVRTAGAGPRQGFFSGYLHDEETEHALVQCCLSPLADSDYYYPAPGWVALREALPVTPTNKIQKSQRFGKVRSPFDAAFDCRTLKQRPPAQGRA